MASVGSLIIPGTQ